ncbi:hypothetical protein SAOR_07865 [Salinisphaera orenii MK-B5]|uniref:Uncharacterized protein n=1 Tax=Salinisphaera orenii MK-B5 TaxID=856730 RepID=A0A423PQJ0_9GAMM|nr:hypothetical protein SAOR_07865 [Salinisphaera orenii MK-B5]
MPSVLGFERSGPAISVRDGVRPDDDRPIIGPRSGFRLSELAAAMLDEPGPAPNLPDTD